ncbi:MAG: MAPEG family protein [Ideonella sp.]|nr:MAPEG family protein [Ideonella sp.]MBL0148017.1 MAPEG family protein [Ideonella sp.]
MNNWSNNPTFTVYAVACLLLCCNLLFLWVYSGAVRGKARSTPNAEDVVRFGATLTETDPAEIARVLRAHSNAQASIVPFVVLGLIYVMAGGPAGPASGYFAVFCLARMLHSHAYLTARQPWRTVWFVSGLAATAGLLLHTAWLLVSAR